MRFLDPLWRKPWAMAGAAAGLTLGWGFVVGRWTPRGPLTTGQALSSIAISLVAGAVAGLVTRSRWAMLGGPFAFAFAVELTRIGVAGPTVDRPHLSTYGVLALVVGRGFHALVSWMPMVLGATVGAGVGRWLSGAASVGEAGERRSRAPLVRRSVAGAATIGLAAFSFALARPARTAPIVAANGEEVPGSIAELSTVRVNGQVLRIPRSDGDPDAAGRHR